MPIDSISDYTAKNKPELNYYLIPVIVSPVIITCHRFIIPLLEWISEKSYQIFLFQMTGILLFRQQGCNFSNTLFFGSIVTGYFSEKQVETLRCSIRALYYKLIIVVVAVSRYFPMGKH